MAKAKSKPVAPPSPVLDETPPPFEQAAANIAALRIGKLREELDRANYQYYVEAAPELSDAEFDAKLDELTALEKQHPHLLTPDSPTQRVGGQPIPSFQSVVHQVPMLSIDKCTTAEELREFDARLRKSLTGKTPIRYTVEPKIDGTSLSLVYRNGLLDTGATRGDGKTGDDVTHNVRTIASVPLRLKTENPPAMFEARGEVFITKADFLKCNEKLGEDVKKHANPRNLAAGTLKLLDPRQCAERPLRFIAYSVAACDGLTLKTQVEALETLKRFGFVVNPETKVYDTIDEVVAYCEAFLARRDSLPYEIDGLVVKLDDLDARAKLGSTAKHVRWAVAYKFAALPGETKVLDIEIHVGKMGEQTPVARVAPVQLAGTTVQYVTLHNAAKLREKDVRIGDTVVMVKRGDIIPHVEYVVKEARTGDEKEFKFPEKCPACAGEVKENETNSGYLCTNVDSCPAQLARRVMKFGMRERMEVEGLGEEMAAALVESGLVKTVADLYKLDEKKLTGLEGVKTKSARNLLQGIEASKNRGLGRLLAALSIPWISETFGPILAKAMPSIDRLLAASKEDFAKIEGFGPRRAASVYEWFHSATGQQIIADLRAAGVKMTEDVKVSTNPQIFAGKTIVVTGTLEKYDRRGIETLIEELGGKPGSGVSKNTDYLIYGEKAGSKLDKAKQLGVKMLSEDEFEKLVAEMKESTPVPVPAPAPAPTPEPAPVVVSAVPSLPTPAPVPVATGGVLAGKTVVFTGTLEKYDRKTASALVERHGGKATTSVGKTTDYVVYGDDAGDKLAKAKQLGLKTLTETEFEALLAAPAPTPEPTSKPATVPPVAPVPAANPVPVVKAAPAASSSGSGKLTGKTIVVTGALMRYDRKGIEALIVQHGGKATGSVSKNTSFVVVGDDAGSKLTKAKDLGIKTMTEDEFLAMLEDGGARDEED